MERFYHCSSNFLGDEGVDQPVSSPEHIPYLEAIIGAMHLFEGAARCRCWVMNIVIPQLDRLSGELQPDAPKGSGGPAPRMTPVLLNRG